MERRAIHVLTSSSYNIHHARKVPSFLDYGQQWHVKLAQQIQAVSDAYAQECWSIDPTLDTPIEWEHEGIALRLFPSKRLHRIGEYSIELLRELKIEAKKRDAILHFHELFTYSTLLAPLVIKEAPMIVQHHGSYSLLQQSRRSPQTARKFGALMLYFMTGNWLLERVSMPKFDRIFVLNQEVEDYVTRLVEPVRVQRLSMGIDFDTFVQTDKARARETLGLVPDKRYILCVGALVALKGIDYLLDALPAILKEFPDTVLLVVGKGYMRERLVTLAQKLQIRANVAFLLSNEDPAIPNDVMPQYYNAADVTVISSWSEGLGLTAIEALACGCPLVATSVGGLPDVLANFKAGAAAVPPRSPEALSGAVIDVLSGKHPFTYDREHAKRVYDWSHIVEKNLEVYDALFDTYYA